MWCHEPSDVSPPAGRIVALVELAPGRTLRAIEDALREDHPSALDDDATIIVLAPSGMLGPAG